MLIKPKRTFQKVLDRLARHRQAPRREAVAEKVKPLFDSADECLVGMLFELQGMQFPIEGLDHSPQFPAGRREHNDVVHESNIKQTRIG